ncbi:MAG: ATP-binding cassette domain-containing protein, partial [Desulfobulbaceae bacterium]|nr:ATP-binding cassette domain-containing protein [Desulfobulbaceae bacterium]
PIEQAVFRLQRLTFTYPAALDPALCDIDLKIGPGILGLAGRTGSGKSTLCKLLVRLYPVDDDVLFFGGQDVNTLSLDTVRSRIGYVGQEPVLFSDTISANIALGKPEASARDIEAAARAAAIHDDIMGFVDRYETRIGERGVKLSGGQRQRIALARALLCDRRVLIIDDALSAIDVETEQQVLAGIRKYLHNRTVLIVSHRINVLRSTDQIIVLDQGVVVDQGRHEELIIKNSLYRAMETKQLTDA